MPVKNTGTVFDISKYAVHDGPGIRTTVFLKGCPLDCVWCHNPESKKIGAETTVKTTRSRPLKLSYTETKDVIGREVTVEEVMKEIEKDLIFYEESGGGVTFSGGEPLMQPAFLESLLKSCKEKAIHTAVDTSGFANWDVFEKILDYIDLFLFDLKIMDEVNHVKYTGVSNKIIKRNLIRLSEAGKKMRIRIPLIPGITDTEENLREIIYFLSPIKNIKEVDLLPYNELSEGKYKRFSKENGLKDLKMQSQEKIDKIINIFKPYGYEITVKG